jgi:hypothetical protein
VPLYQLASSAALRCCGTHGILFRLGPWQAMGGRYKGLHAYL